MKRVFVALFVVILLLILFSGGGVLYNIRDRNRGYELDVTLPKQLPAYTTDHIKVGLASVPITPILPDKWVDADSNGRFDSAKGDSLIDGNGNKKLDAIYLAGFHNNRPAAGIHDDIWARCVVWDDGDLRVAYVALDAIGFFHDDVIQVRKQVAQKPWRIDHVIISATHCHEVPDLMGLWGKSPYRSGVNQEYKKLVKERIVQVIGEAFENRRPATIKLSRIDSVGADLVADGRPPFVFDKKIYLMQFCDAKTDSTFGLLMNWGNHPEALGSDNVLITADFAHYWLSGIEKGIVYGDEQKRNGIAATAVFANGPIGGLMTPLGTTVYDPWLNRNFRANTFDKARAMGYRLADQVLNQLESGKWDTVKTPMLRLRAKTFLLPVENKYYILGGALNLFHRGFIRFKQVRSEINLLTIGPAWILTIPGEINPEIVNGGVEVPDGADFDIQPVEVPPLRELMRGDYNFVIGLANDEIGYIMPKTHWDTQPPYTYGSNKGFYGEVNSLGPETGPLIYKTAKELIVEM